MYRATFLVALAILPFIVVGEAQTTAVGDIIDGDDLLSTGSDQDADLSSDVQETEAETEQELEGKVESEQELEGKANEADLSSDVQETEAEAEQELEGQAESEQELEGKANNNLADEQEANQEAEQELEHEDVKHEFSSDEQEADQELDMATMHQDLEQPSGEQKAEQELDFETENDVEQELAKEERRPREAFLARRPIDSLLALGEGVLPVDTRALAYGRHPAVARKLKDMDHEIRGVKSRHTVAKQMHKTLEEEVAKVNVKVSDVISIKHQMAMTQAQVRREERKLKKLEDDRVHLDMTHKSLTGSLHHIMGPKIEFAKARMNKRKAQLKMLTARADKWKAEEEAFHAKSLSMLEHRRKDTENVANLAAEEDRIHQERAKADKELHDAKLETRNDIEGYRYSEAEVKAAMSQQQRSQEETAQAETSVKRLSQILNMEEKRVDESMSHGKDKVLGKIQQVEDDEKDSNNQLDTLKHEYTEWQQSIQSTANHLDSTKANTHAAAKEYANAQKNVLDAANDRVVMDAESDSDWGWDDWGQE